MKHVLQFDDDGQLLVLGEPILCMYPAGDCDYVTKDNLDETAHSALYDYYQCEDEPFHDGDTIVINGVEMFGVVGVHIVKIGA